MRVGVPLAERARAGEQATRRRPPTIQEWGEDKEEPLDPRPLLSTLPLSLALRRSSPPPDPSAVRHRSRSTADLDTGEVPGQVRRNQPHHSTRGRAPVRMSQAARRTALCR
jgi:hypothetical protein